MSRAVIVAAPGSGSGKTTLTLALLRGLREAGIAVASAKVGPDYIDPAYHAAASGRTCHNLDTWSMSDRTLSALIADLRRDASAIVVEGVMGLFDGAPDGRGSAADLSRRTGWPVVLVVDASGMAASVAALVHGFVSYDPGVEVAGVIFNRTGSKRHGELLRRAMQPLGIPVFGCVTRSECLELPDRHLGLVQAREHPDLEGFLTRAAEQISREVDTEALLAAARPASFERLEDGYGLPVLGQRIAVARDDAFAFCYPYVLDAWRRAGCEISFFSPIDDEPPMEGCRTQSISRAGIRSCMLPGWPTRGGSRQRSGVAPSEVQSFTVSAAGTWCWVGDWWTAMASRTGWPVCYRWKRRSSHRV